MHSGLTALELCSLNATMSTACVAGIEALTGEVCCDILSVPCALEVFTIQSAERGNGVKRRTSERCFATKPWRKRHPGEKHVGQRRRSRPSTIC